MTIPRKSSRPIEVDGRQYRWTVKKANEDTVRLTVEDTETGEIRQREYRDRDGGLRTVLPGDVKEFVLYAFPRPGLDSDAELG